MKELSKQVGISVLFVALFAVMQVGAQFALGYGYLLYGQLAGWQMSAEELSAAANAFMAANVELQSLLSGCATILIVWLFSAVRKRNFIQECNLVQFDLKNLYPIVFMVIGSLMFISGIFSFLSENLMYSYEEHMNRSVEGIVVTFVSTAIVAPIAEELVFRGVIMRSLNKSMNIVLAAIFTNVAFGLLHVHLVQVTYAMVLGLILSFIAVRCGSLLAACFFHILFNALGSLPIIDNFLGDSIVLTFMKIIIGLVLVIAAIAWLNIINKRTPDYAAVS